MKRLMFIPLSVLALATLSTPAFASEMTAFNQTPISNIVEVQPVNLVALAYQGYFKDKGIPSAGALELAVATGRVDAEALVRSAIQKGRLSSETLNDSGYLHIVEVQLKSLSDR